MAIFVVNKENPTYHVTKTLCTSCCMFNSEILRGKAVVDCWLQSRPLFDRSSLLLDIELLQKLTEGCTLDSKDLFEVNILVITTVCIFYFPALCRFLCFFNIMPST